MASFSLRTKILLLIASTVIGLSAILMIVTGTLARRQVELVVRGDVRATGGIEAVSVRDRSAILISQCLLLARQPALHMMLGTDVATFSDYARDRCRELQADIIRITDRDGRLLGASDVTSSAASEEGQTQEAQAAMRGETYSGIALLDGKPMIAVSVPVREPVSKYVLATFIAYSAIDSNLARELKNALGSDVAFVHNGQVVGASLPLPARIPTPKETPQQASIQGKGYYALYAPLPGADPKEGLGFVVLRPLNTGNEAFHQVKITFLVLTLLTLLALAAGTTVAQGIARPLDSVVQAAQTLREGGWPEQFVVRRADEIGLLQSVFNEMTAAMRADQERLLALIDTDPLTGLDNHRRFQERLTQETRRCAASGEALSLLLLDLDHFYDFNQWHGHANGDDALRQVADALRNALPEVAIVARYGGEEFSVLLPQHNVEQAEALGDRIREIIAGLRFGDTQEPVLTMSVGCAEFGLHTTQAEGLTLAAEVAVSLAKQLGRNRTCRFENVPGADHANDPALMVKFVQDGSFATIQALAAAVDAKDPYTQGHSQRVAEYARELAQVVGLPKAEIDLIYTTGTLHDVGKIGVPDAILQKPGRLDEAERALMETHPVLGEVIVRKVPQLASTLPGVRHHHERWDGKGYPDKLAGEAIPRMARILAVADTFDAMTSDRPYRKGMALETALDEIAKNAGAQFDPELALAFVTLWRTKRSALRAA